MGVLFVICGYVYAGSNSSKFDFYRGWDTTDTLFQVTYTAIHVIDWGQTVYTARNPRKYEEENNILGGHPTVGKVNSYFIITGIGHAVVSWALPKKINIAGFNVPIRNIWQATWICIEAGQVQNNYRIGVKVSF